MAENKENVVAAEISKPDRLLVEGIGLDYLAAHIKLNANELIEFEESDELVSYGKKLLVVAEQVKKWSEGIHEGTIRLP